MEQQLDSPKRIVLGLQHAVAMFGATVLVPLLTGPIIMVIGLTLSPVAIGMASEHWGVAAITRLAVTRVYDPSILRIATLFAIGLAFFGKLGALLRATPPAVMGGISILLFGMICAIGIRTLVEARVNFAESRNLTVTAIILVLGLGGRVSRSQRQYNYKAWRSPPLLGSC